MHDAPPDIHAAQAALTEHCGQLPGFRGVARSTDVRGAPVLVLYLDSEDSRRGAALPTAMHGIPIQVKCIGAVKPL